MFKKEEEVSKESYRSAGVLSRMSKIIERIVFNQVKKGKTILVKAKRLIPLITIYCLPTSQVTLVNWKRGTLRNFFLLFNSCKIVLYI